MSISKVNSIYESFKKKEINKEKAISLLMEEVFKYPSYYNINKFTEDQKNDFLIWNYKGMNSLLDNFNDSYSSFLTYFTTTIRFQTKTWKKLTAKEKARQYVLDIYHDEQLQKYESKDEIYTSEPIIQYGNKNLHLSEKHKITLLILALKNYPSLNLNHFEKIPILIGISQKQFLNYIEKIKKITEKNIENFNNADNKLGYAFIKCKQYNYELKNLDEELSQYYSVQTKLEKEKKLLEKKRKLYFLSRKRIYPKNTTIDTILNLKYGTSSRVIKNAPKYLYDIKEILDREGS